MDKHFIDKTFNRYGHFIDRIYFIGRIYRIYFSDRIHFIEGIYFIDRIYRIYFISKASTTQINAFYSEI